MSMDRFLASTTKCRICSMKNDKHSCTLCGRVFDSLDDVVAHAKERCGALEAHLQQQSHDGSDARSKRVSKPKQPSDAAAATATAEKTKEIIHAASNSRVMRRGFVR